MSTIAGTTQGTRSRPSRQDSSAGNVTRSLLGYLALAGPCYVVVSLAQALTRHGFDLARDEWSLLALGRLGWIQQAPGVVGIVFAVGFAGIATGAASEAISLGFTAAVIISSAWLTAVAIDLYRRTRTADAGRRALARPVPQPAMKMKGRRQG